MKRELTIGLLEDIPKFEGKGEQPFSHLMEFEDYLIASGVRMEPDEDESGRRIDVDYRDIINKFKASLKKQCQGFGIVCTLMVGLQICTQRQDGKQSRVVFLTYFNPIGKYQGTTNKSLERIDMET